MKKIAAVISGALFAVIAVSSAQASGDEGYEHHERYEYGGNRYNPYGYNYGYNNYGSSYGNYNNSYRNHELREYGGRYMNSVPVYGGSYYGGYIDDDAYKYNRRGYKNHDRYEYSR